MKGRVCTMYMKMIRTNANIQNLRKMVKIKLKRQRQNVK